MKDDRILRIYTDGACSGNQSEKNFGGWGAILEFAGHSKELYGGEKNTTNNRMEMTALLEAFRAIKKENQTIEVYSDSSYLMDCFRKKWYKGWLRNGWKTAAKKPVENRDLWEGLLPYLDRHAIRFFRVKGMSIWKALPPTLKSCIENSWSGTENSIPLRIFSMSRKKTTGQTSLPIWESTRYAARKGKLRTLIS